MSERTKFRRALEGTAVAGLAAVALMAGASKAKAGAEAPVKDSGIEMVHDRLDRLSVREAQAQAQMKLAACQDNSFLRGSVVALNPRTGESMFSVDYPVLVLRDQVEVGGKQPSQWVFDHPGDPKHWVAGYIRRQDGKIPTVAMINPEHARLVFNVYEKSSPAPVVDAFRCNLDKAGQPDPDHPLNVVGQLLNTSAGQPIKIGVRTASGGFLNIPPRK